MYCKTSFSGPDSGRCIRGESRSIGLTFIYSVWLSVWTCWYVCDIGGEILYSLIEQVKILENQRKETKFTERKKF